MAPNTAADTAVHRREGGFLYNNLTRFAKDTMAHDLIKNHSYAKSADNKNFRSQCFMGGLGGVRVSGCQGL